MLSPLGYRKIHLMELSAAVRPRSIATDLLLRFPIKPHLRAMEILKRISSLAEPVGIELGVWRGKLSRALLMGHTGLMLYMVDSWAADGGDYLDPKGDPKAFKSLQEMAEALDRATRVTGFAASRRIVQRAKTADAAQRFENLSVDFVFVDADHSYEGCKADIDAYWPKIKHGGWLSGHDYDRPNRPKFGVKRAADAFAAAVGSKVETGRNTTWFIRKP